MTPTERLLDRLVSVRQTGRGTWMARCPSHEDRRASLSVREGDDGRVLLHDFAGCPVEAIVSALGLDLVDLFPPRLGGDDARREWRRRHAPRIPAADALRVLDVEALMVCAMARKLADCALLTDEEHASMHLAHERVAAVCDAWRLQR